MATKRAFKRAPKKPAKQTLGATETTTAVPTPVRIQTGVVEISDAARTGISDVFERAFQKASDRYEREARLGVAGYQPAKPQAVSRQTLDRLIGFVEGPGNFETDNHLIEYARDKDCFGEWFSPPGVRLVHVVRLAYAIHDMDVPLLSEGLSWLNLHDLALYRSRCKQLFGLRELDAAVASLPDVKPDAVALAYLANNTGWSSFCDWEPEWVWPLFAERLDMLRDLVIGEKRPEESFRNNPAPRRNAFKVLGMFPRLPEDLVRLLWDLALGDSKPLRPMAQDALVQVPGKLPRILAALKDGQQDIRASAAEWLGRLGDRGAVKLLKRALLREKQEVVKGAVLAALELLGADLGEFLDRNELLTEATTGLKKMPKRLAWLPLHALPVLHWRDSDQEVDRRIVQWWVVQSIQHESPVCGPLLSRYLAMCRPHDAGELARVILAAWIARDTRVPSHEEAAAKAKRSADLVWSREPAEAKYVYGTKERTYRLYLQRYSKKCLGSAMPEKGMLAIVSAAGDGACAKSCETYIRTWCSTRTAQAKILLEVLGRMQHPLAIQVLLAFANRFRKKMVQKAARAHVQAMAEREGWNLDELADRSIPDAGFSRPVDENGRPTGADASLVLDFGRRSFSVRLDDNLEPIIATADGKTVKNLPSPGGKDDPVKARAARRVFADAKKLVKEVVKRQTDRFYEAMCTQRSWSFHDWESYLANHPIAGKLCVRLIWAAFKNSNRSAGERAEQFLGCFRPLEDGSLTNERDETVKLAPETLVRLAHTCNVPEPVGVAFSRHLVDYDATPLFPQLGRETYRLSEEGKLQITILDFQGHMLDNFKLRSKATKLGYLRGPIGDGGLVYSYRKPFAALGLEAVIEFSGSFIEPQEGMVALISLHFIPLREDSDWNAYTVDKLELGKIPPLLLNESYNDIRQIAAEGSGFNRNWQKSVSF